MFNDNLTKAISNLSCALREGLEQRKIEFDWLKSHAGLATKQDLNEMEKRIMSKLSEYLSKQTDFNTRLQTATDSLVESMTGLTEDVDTLNKKIEELQNSTGGVTPDDQLKIDSLEAQGDALSTKLEGVSTALAALNQLTPPPPPPPV
jgi:predicted  nucleic acid-binding Zn-ribbon protein